MKIAIGSDHAGFQYKERIKAYLVERGETVVITRRGKPVAALVRAADVEKLERLRAAGPQGGLASVAGGWRDAKELISSIAGAPRKGRLRSAGLEE